MTPILPKRYVLRLLGTLVAFFFAVELHSAHAVTVDQSSVLPNADSFEYFGLNYLGNVQTSSTVGTLDYTGYPGCGGTCSATTQLGSSPSVFATVNEVVFNGGSGGIVEARLGYYVAYLNATPGTYNVNLHATDSLSGPSASGSAYVAVGPAASGGGFSFKTFQMADCVNGCPPPGFNPAVTVPFASDSVVQMDANTLYYIQLDLMFRPGPANTPNTGSIDSMFTADGLGGEFIYSPGVFSASASTPLPAALPLFATGVGAMGLLGWRRKRKSAAAIAA
jgi:hypothetical protein